MRVTFEDGERTTLLARLGLPESTSDEDLAAAAATRLMAETAPPPAPPGETEAQRAEREAREAAAAAAAAAAGGGAEEEEENDDLDDSDDTVVLDVAAYRSLTARAGRATELQEADRVRTRDDLIEGAIRVGKFPPSRRDHYVARYDDDPEQVTARIARMAENVVPLEERGRDVAAEDLEAKSDDYPREWVAEVPIPGQTTSGQQERPRVIHGGD